MYTIKKKGDKELELKFKKTNYYKNKIYIQQDERLLNFYEMPAIDITDIGSIRTAFLFRQFVFDKNKELVLLYQTILVNIVLGLILWIIGLMVKYYDVKPFSDLLMYLVIIFVPYNLIPYLFTFCYYMLQLAEINECFSTIKHSINTQRNLINSLC
jgi:hypothetical protein